MQPRHRKHAADGRARQFLPVLQRGDHGEASTRSAWSVRQPWRRVRASGAVPNAEYLLAAEGIRKEFPGVVALDDVSVPPEARLRACADGRERRGQIDPDEDPCRHLSPDTGRSRAQGRRMIRLKSPLDALRKRHRA